MVQRITGLLTALLTLTCAAGCGYGLRGSGSPLLEREKVRTLFVAPIENETYKPGVEQTAYNAVVRTLEAQLDVRVVDDVDKADAILHGTITRADVGSASTSRANTLLPLGSGDPNRLVTTQYSATLTMHFSLSKGVKKTRERRTVWSSGFTRQQYVQANTQLGTLGTTSHLINESEFNRAFDVLAERISRDLSESFVAFF